MPDHKTHCMESLRKYGKSFSELHRWMDEPCRGLGPSHRMYRHDLLRTPREARKIFGEFADHACIDHILLDRAEAEIPSRSGVIPSRSWHLVVEEDS